MELWNTNSVILLYIVFSYPLQIEYSNLLLRNDIQVSCNLLLYVKQQLYLQLFDFCKKQECVI
jgi:hypothetical protein